MNSYELKLKINLLREKIKALENARKDVQWIVNSVGMVDIGYNECERMLLNRLGEVTMEEENG